MPNIELWIQVVNEYKNLDIHTMNNELSNMIDVLNNFKGIIKFMVEGVKSKSSELFETMQMPEGSFQDIQRKKSEYVYFLLDKYFGIQKVFFHYQEKLNDTQRKSEDIEKKLFELSAMLILYKISRKWDSDSEHEILELQSEVESEIEKIYNRIEKKTEYKEQVEAFIKNMAEWMKAVGIYNKNMKWKV